MNGAESTTRREFLQGKPIRDAAECRADTGTEPDPTPAVHTYQLQFSRPAMACEFAVYLNAGQYEHGPEVALDALDQLETFEQQLSIYRETSEVRQINAQAALEPVRVETRLYALLRQSQRLALDTAGAFDITSEPLSRTWGFSRRAGAIPADDDLRHALACVGSQFLRFDDQAETVAFDRPGLEIGLGSIGKGYALDRLAERMSAAGVDHFLVHGGQSSVLARGACGNRESFGGGWAVGVGDPLQPTRRLAEVRLQNQALGTSGASVQFFRYRGKRYGHILDPRTGWPAEGVFSSTVIAPTAAEADALATAFYVLGVDAASDYCRTHPEISALLTLPTSSGSQVETVAINLRDDQWRRWSSALSP